VEERGSADVSFFGLGYVGLAGAVCFSTRGFEVNGVDIDRRKVRKLSRGIIPFYEPKLSELFTLSRRSGKLKIGSTYGDSLGAMALFICVGTPSLKSGIANLSQVKSAAVAIGRVLRRESHYSLVVVRSTVPPGTTNGTVRGLIEKHSGKKLGEFGLCCSPEFLREGRAIDDTFLPDRLIIGECDKRSGDALEALYKRFYGRNLPTTVRCAAVNAELAKYASNAFLATKISFINEIADLCEKAPGADVVEVADAIGMDKRIGRQFLNAGLGYGGSCLPKDARHLISFGKRVGVEMHLLKGVTSVNDDRPRKVAEAAERFLGNLSGKRISILGLSSKPETDDLREAVSLRLIRILLRRKADVIAYDPVAIPNARHVLGNEIKFASSVRKCLSGSDCCIIATEWPKFSKLGPMDFLVMRRPLIIDGRRIFESSSFSGKFELVSVGRSPSGMGDSRTSFAR